MVMNWLKAKRDQLSAEVTKYRNKDFMQAIVAGSAIVAAADGTIASAEKQKMAGFLRNSDELKHFDTNEVIAFFNKITESFEFDAEIGRAEALRTIGRVKGNPDQARLLVRVVCAIGASDGNFDESEKAAVRTICNELGLNPQDFDL